MVSIHLVMLFVPEDLLLHTIEQPKSSLGVVHLPLALRV